jgi:AcrR family transcriptional regulator
MRSRQRWLHEGLAILAESGISGLTIETLSARLELSKGSFYHHFQGMPGYRRALLQYFEERESQDFIERANAAPEPAGEPRLRYTVADVMAAEGGRPQLEKAVRNWASSDSVAREYLDRIDRARVDFVQEQFEAMNLDRHAAAEFAKIAYLMSIGAAQTVPALEPPEIARLWDRLLTAANSCAAASRPGD